MSDSAVQTWTKEAKKNSKLLVILGVLTIVAGVLAIVSPMMAGVAIALLVGFFLAAGGFLRIIGAFMADSFGSGALAFLVGMLGVVAGLIMVARPGIGLATLTLMLAVYFFAEGIMEIVVGFKMKPDSGWGWTVFNGAIAIILGIMIGREWPMSGTWAVGTLVGIHLIFSGLAGIGIGSAAKGVADDVEAATA